MQAPHRLFKQALAILLVLFALSSPALLASSITSPTMGSTLDGGAQTITWDTGGQTVEQWAIYAGSSVGSFDYFVSGNIGHATSTIVQFLPVNGTAVHIRLWLKIAGVWEIIDASYFASQYTFSLALGSTLAGANQNLTWTTNGGTITQWALYAGSSPGNFDYYVGGGANASNSVTTIISGLPTDSSVVYFQMWMQVGGYWEKLDVSYNAVAPYTITPANGATFTSVSEMFTWNTTGGTIDEWAFYAGSSPGNFDYHIDTGTGATNSTTASALPDNGSLVYVRIWLKIESNWEKVDLTYTSFEAEFISITSPVTGNNLDGSSQQFIWDPQGQSIDSWVLYLGSVVGADDYHISSGLGTSTSSVTTGLPTDNSTVYVRLWYQLSGESFLRKIDETYTAAPLDILWDRTLGSTGSDILRGILFDQGLSSIYAVGGRNSDGVIVTLSPSGTASLENTFGGSNADSFYDISPDGKTNFYAVGYTFSNDGDITDGNNGGTDALLVKFDKNHAVSWHRTIGGTSDDRFYGVTVDSTGNIHAAGYTDSNDGDISDGNNGSEDALLVKFDTDGNKLWDKTIGGSSNDRFSALALDASGNIYAAGFTRSNDGDISDGSNGFNWDTLLVKFDSNGNKLWDKTIGGSGNDIFNALALDASGNIYAAGYTVSNDGDINDGNNGFEDALLVKFDTDGNKLWDKTIGGNTTDEFSTLALDASGTLYAAGYTLSNDGDITDGNNGSFDTLLVKFDTDGNNLWDKTIGGSSTDTFSALALDASGTLYAAGSTESNDGDITDGNNGSRDELIFSLSE